VSAETADPTNGPELQREAAEARFLACLFRDNDAAIADLLAYASMLEAALPQRH